MNSDIIVLVSFGLSIITWGLIGKWYVMPRLNAMPRPDALTPLLLFHSFRHIGLVFLVPGVVSHSLTPAFAYPAAYGDLLAAILGLIAIGALRMGCGGAVPLVWIFNLEGTVDLLYAVFQGLRNHVAEQLGAAYFIPAIVVPALLITHYMIFQLLLKDRQT